MNTDRLLLVARALRESPNPEGFDMGSYFGPECGTPACALGHYICRPDLQNEFAPLPEEEGNMLFFGCHRDPDGRLLSYHSDCVLDHFGITHSQSNELFAGPEQGWDDDDNLIERPGGCGGAKTTLEAAEWIEAFVARHREAQPSAAADE